MLFFELFNIDAHKENLQGKAKLVWFMAPKILLAHQLLGFPKFWWLYILSYEFIFIVKMELKILNF
jgi:hypothetical protein